MINKTKKSQFLNKKKKHIISTSFTKLYTVSYINLYSQFIIDLKNPRAYYNLLKNKNSIKLRNNEYDF